MHNQPVQIELIPHESAKLTTNTCAFATFKWIVNISRSSVVRVNHLFIRRSRRLGHDVDPLLTIIRSFTAPRLLIRINKILINIWF